jgi:hypothetical protein
LKVTVMDEAGNRMEKAWTVYRWDGAPWIGPYFYASGFIFDEIWAHIYR